MLSIRTSVIGSTPIRTTSSRPLRRRLDYETPQRNAQQTPTEANAADVTMTTRQGTLVKHINDFDSDRSDKIGVITDVTAGPEPTTLDVLWTDDGSTTSVLPANLRIYDPSARQSVPTASMQSNDFSPAKSFYGPSVSKGYTRLLPSKLPEGLECPLDSIDSYEVEIFQRAMDNFLCSSHPRIRQLLTGQLEPPLLTYEPYLKHMREQCAPEDYVFSHSTADEDIAQMRSKNLFDLAEKCDTIMDNPPSYDGFRPCNNAVYQALLKSLKPTDMYVTQDTVFGDGISLRNTLWEKMNDDAIKSKKLMAMTYVKKISDVKYKLQRHGIAKYFAEIHKTLAKLRALGAQKQDWEIFSTIFEHMSEQCTEYRDVVKDIRDQLADNEDSVTLKSIQAAFTRKETVHGLGTRSRGTPIPGKVTMTPPPAVPAAKARTVQEDKSNGTSNGSTVDRGSKFWKEKTAKSRYGPKGSHQKGACKYYRHKHDDDHCWSGCSKCGGCEVYHKRNRMMDDGLKLCTVHKFALHFDKNCKRHQHQNERESSARSNSKGYKNSDNYQRSSRKSYKANSARRRSRSRSRSRSRNQSRHNRYRSRSRSRSPSRRTGIPAKYIKPEYLERLERFARCDRSGDRRHNDPAYPWSSANNGNANNNARASSMHNTNPNAASSQFSPASAMQTQHARRRNMGHVPANDGTKQEFINMIHVRNAKVRNSRYAHTRTNRRVVASAAMNRPVQRAPQTLMDTGAGITVCDDERLYIPGSKSNFPGDVQWGDGSRKGIQYAGRAPAIGKMLHTGGHAVSNLLSVGSVLDNLHHDTGKQFVMAFDRFNSYLMRDAKFHKRGDKGFTLSHPTQPDAIMETSKRSSGEAGVYEVPLYESNADHTQSKTPAVNAATIKAFASLPTYRQEPDWRHLKKCIEVYDAEVEVPTANASAISKEIMRKHRVWGHPAKRVLREMLLAKGTQRSKRLAKKVDTHFTPCNDCLSGLSRAQPHKRDMSQPTTKPTRPLQHVMSDCLGAQNIAASETPTLSGAKTLFLTSCQYSHYGWAWLIKSLREVTPAVKEWLKLTIRQKKRIADANDTAILTWRTDNGPEFPTAFTDLLASFDIEHQRGASKSSEHNGGAENYNGIISRKTRTQLAWARAPRPWWGEASMYTVITTNHLCCMANKNNAAPITVLFKRKPDFDKMHPFGCLAFIHIAKQNRNGALNTATHYGALLGYVTGTDGRILGYRVHNYDTNRIVHPHNVTFNDDIPAIPYIASLRQLAPPVRLRNRSVCKKFNGVEYHGKVTHIRKDTDGELLYGVTYSDNDYEEYNFQDIMHILQPYDPQDDIDEDVIEITPFFGSANKHMRATDAPDTEEPIPALKQNATETGKASTSRRSARVRVVRRPHNVGETAATDIPSSQNRRRLRKAMFTRTLMYEDICALAAAHKPRNCKLVQPITIPPDTFVDQLPLPTGYDDAVTGPYRNYWIPAIAEEMQNLRNNKVWHVQRMPLGTIPIRGKFVFKWKPDANNHLARAKVRFTMQGCRQIRGVHYLKTYAPVAYAASVRVGLKLGVDLDYLLDVTDLRAAYLTAHLEPDISLFLEPPPGVKVEEGFGLRLSKALYGSMQGAQRLDVLKHKALEGMGFTRMSAETSIYFMPPTSELGLVIIVTIVDDFLIMARNRKIMAEIKRRLRTVWEISDKGPVKWMLNVRISRDRPAGLLKIDQSAYIEKKLREFNLDKLPAKTLPMPPTLKLSSSMCPTTEEGKREAAKLNYRSRTGSLNYLRLTRPDLCCTNSILSQFNKAWGKAHYDATTHAWQYASGTKNYGLIMRKSGWKLGQKARATVYVDAGHGSCPDTRRSRGGFFLYLNGDIVDYECKLQPGAPAQSTAVAEYRAVTGACNAVIWLRSCLKQLGIELHEPVLFREDNEACINMATNYMTTKRTKHVDVKHHVIRYWCKEGVMDFAYIDTHSQLADIMTKILTKPAFVRHRSHCMTDMHVDDVTGPYHP